MPSPALSVLRSVFGHEAFRADQEQVIDRALSGQHSLVLMPTGMGKSLCYQIPAIVLCRETVEPGEKRPITLVLSPLIALMKDQVDALVAKGVSATFINSSLDRQSRESRYREIASGVYDLLYITPERFRKSDFVEALSQRDVKLLAVDEAHCISEWGHDFRPDYTRVGDLRKQLGNPVTVALTATATPDVQRDIVLQLGLEPEQMPVFNTGIDRPNLRLDVAETWGDDDKLKRILEARSTIGGRGIVYFTLIRTLLEFSDLLVSKHVPHLVYHGDLDRRERKRIQDLFMNEPNQLVLATNAFGMGIDCEDIRFVMHADVPGSLESYYQEIGRAGRDGLPSECLLLYDQKDLATQMEFIRWSNPDSDYYRGLFSLLSDETEHVNAFGIEWIRQRMEHGKRPGRRLETALAMLERWSAFEGTIEPLYVKSTAELPERLADPEYAATKLERDQRKLLAMVEYVRCEGDRKEVLKKYFGLTID